MVRTSISTALAGLVAAQQTRKIAVVVLLAAAAALPAVADAGQPVIRDHESFVDGPSPSSACGVVAGTETTTGTFTFAQDASGAFRATGSKTTVFTASTTGKSVEFSSAGVDMGAGVDNGDGTITFTEQSAGLAVTFKIPNGPLLKSSDGKPLIGAGVVSSAATFDIATGDLVSVRETWDGPHPLHDGVDVCGPTVAYLAS